MAALAPSTMLPASVATLGLRNLKKLRVSVPEHVDRAQAAFRISVAIDLVVLLVLIEQHVTDRPAVRVPEGRALESLNPRQRRPG